MSLEHIIVVSTKRRACTSKDVKCHLLHRHECFAGDHNSRKIHRKIRPSGVFSILGRVLMTSFFCFLGLFRRKQSVWLYN